MTAQIQTETDLFLVDVRPMTFPFNRQKFNDTESGSMHVRHTVYFASHSIATLIYSTIISRKSVLADNNNNNNQFLLLRMFDFIYSYLRVAPIPLFYYIFIHNHSSFTIYRGESPLDLIHAKMRDVFTHCEKL